MLRRNAQPGESLNPITGAGITLWFSPQPPQIPTIPVFGRSRSAGLQQRFRAEFDTGVITCNIPETALFTASIDGRQGATKTIARGNR